MTETLQSMGQKISVAEDLHGIVRSMKAMALSNITLFEQAVMALSGYSRVIETALGACFREIEPLSPLFDRQIRKRHSRMTAIVFGSDHGLVGPFNEVIASYSAGQIDMTSPDLRICAVGDRVKNRLERLGATVAFTLPVPHSVPMITDLVGLILNELMIVDEHLASGSELQVFYNQPLEGFSYDPVRQQILPFNQTLRHQWIAIGWPTTLRPEIIGSLTGTIRALLREFLFVSLYRACALSLASENASRLAAMQRADRNIDDLLVELGHAYHQLRQNEIDADLFDRIIGYEPT